MLDWAYRSYAGENCVRISFIDKILVTKHTYP